MYYSSFLKLQSQKFCSIITTVWKEETTVLNDCMYISSIKQLLAYCMHWICRLLEFQIHTCLLLQSSSTKLFSACTSVSCTHCNVHLSFITRPRSECHYSLKMKCQIKIVLCVHRQAKLGKEAWKQDQHSQTTFAACHAVA